MKKKGKKRTYPSRMSGVYLSAIIVAWSVILAFLLLQNTLLLFYYVSSASLIAAIVFLLKIRSLNRPLFANAQRIQKKDSLQPEDERVSWKVLILVFMMLLAALFIPLFLAWVLPGEAWFVLIISFTSGVSIAEVLFYLYLR